MFSKDRKSFRYRFMRVMALVYLLNSPTQASSTPKGCAEVMSAWETTEAVTLVQDDHKFIGSLAECIDGVKEGKKFMDKLEPIIQQLPELLEKTLPVAKEGGLVLLSVYVIYRSFELYNRAMNLERDYKMYHNEFEALEVEMEPYKDFIVTQLIPQWEKGNTSNLLNITDKLLGKMARQLTVMRELIRAIHTGTKNAESDNRWSVFYSIATVAACGCSIYVFNVPVIVAVCGVGLGTILLNFKSYDKNKDTLTKLDLLGEEANIMRKEITKYRAQLDVAKMTGELYI